MKEIIAIMILNIKFMHFLLLLNLVILIGKSVASETENITNLTDSDINLEKLSIGKLATKIDRLEKLLEQNPKFVEDYQRLKAQEIPIADYLKEVLVAALKARPLLSKFTVGSSIQKIVAFIMNIINLFHQ